MNDVFKCVSAVYFTHERPKISFEKKKIKTNSFLSFRLDFRMHLYRTQTREPEEIC